MHATFDENDLYPTIFEKAAALFESICKNHPFVDGNKRTAFTSAVTFLEINGYKTKFQKDKTEKFVIGVASQKVQFQEIVNFFENNIV